MLCDSQALKELRANACTDALGKRGDAGTSFTEQTRKPEKSGALLTASERKALRRKRDSEVNPPGPQSFPIYDRVEFNGQVAILINDGRGWLAHCVDGVHQNPWTGAPFRQLCHARNAIKARFKFGRWPGKKRQPITKVA